MDRQRANRAAAGDGVKGSHKRSGQIGPCRPAIGRLENSSPGVTILVVIVLARSGVNDVVVGWIDGDGPDGKANLPIGEWTPTGTTVGRFPHATVRPASIKDAGVGRIDNQRSHPSRNIGRASEGFGKQRNGWLRTDKGPGRRG